MAGRNRRRTRPRHHRSHRDQDSLNLAINPTFPTFPSHRLNSRPSARHWQGQWESWQMRRQVTTLPLPESRGQAIPSITANVEIVKHRIQLFGGEERDGTELCGPMLEVVMNLFDGRLDYKDP